MTDTFRVRVRFKALKPGWQAEHINRLLLWTETLPRPSGPFWKKSITPPGSPGYGCTTQRPNDPIYRLWNGGGIWS